MMRRLRCLLSAMVIGVAPAGAQRPAPVDTVLERIVRDYTGLYSRDSFDVWTQLFRPGFTSLSTNADGTLTFRSLKDFLEAQRLGFQRAREMREELENVRIEQQGRLAAVWADFVFHYDGRASRGKLVLLAAADSGGWRFSSLMFSYDRNP
ncbi:MAG TPA: nuclear transport factor 2 family protein [Gemmatimonadales bacterium]